jgi:hypothetical protein
MILRDKDDVDMAEWRRLRRLRTLLEPLASIFERTNSECTGDCDRPKVIYQDSETGVKITCCSLRHPWERYHEVKKLERVMHTRVSTGKKTFETARNRRVESPLGTAYPRSFTGTYVGAKEKLMEVEPDKEEDEGKPKGH